MSEHSKAPKPVEATPAPDKRLDPRDVTFVMIEAGVSRLQAATALADYGGARDAIDILKANRDSEGVI